MIVKPGPAFVRLALSSSRHLEDVFHSGGMPDFGELAGREFLGYNPPALAQLIGIGKFVKGFLEGGRGYNRSVRRSRIEEPWELSGPPDESSRFGFYEVRRVDPDRPTRDDRYTNSLLLDYGSGGNPWWSPTRLLRDYLVRVEIGPELVYLGKAYLALGNLRVFAGFFLIGEPATPPDARGRTTPG